MFHKLLISYAGIGLSVILITSYVFYTNFLDALVERALFQLESVNVLKKKQLSSFITESKNKYKSKINRRELEGNYIISDASGIVLHLSGDIKLPKNKVNIYNVSDTLKVADALLVAPFSEVYIAFQKQLSSDTVITFLSSTDHVNSILKERAGMGLTGESYLVGEDKKMRTASRFYPERNPFEHFCIHKRRSESRERRIG